MNNRSAIGFFRYMVLSILLSTATQVWSADFDHDATRFPLQGFHRYVECEECHINGQFKGTPTRCFQCHNGSSAMPARGKSFHHMPTSNECEDCHRSVDWEVITRFDHSQVVGDCAQCHNGVMQPGKPAGHVLTSERCDTCHNVFDWMQTRFNHAGITAPCSSCHNGSQATGKPANHVATTRECSDCHSTRGWLPAGFDHQGVTGTCDSCHNGTNATGKNSGHFVTNRQCDSCHSTSRWTPTTFRHQSPGYPGDHRVALQCRDCHGSNSEAVTWDFPAYQPDCAACHANRFSSGQHGGQSVSTLRDCSGACHAGSGHHRVTDSSFGD